MGPPRPWSGAKRPMWKSCAWVSEPGLGKCTKTRFKNAMDTYKLLMVWLLSLKIFKNLNSRFHHSKNSIRSPKHNKVTYNVSSKLVFFNLWFHELFYPMLDWAWTVKTYSTILKLKTADRNLTARGKALTLTIFVALPFGARVDGEDGGGSGGWGHELDGVWAARGALQRLAKLRLQKSRTNHHGFNSLCSLEYIQKHTVSMHTQTHDIHSPCPPKHMTYIPHAHPNTWHIFSMHTQTHDIHSPGTPKHMTYILCVHPNTWHTFSMHTRTHDIHSPYIKTCDIHCPCTRKLMMYILPTSKRDIHSQYTHKHMTYILLVRKHILHAHKYTPHSLFTDAPHSLCTQTPQSLYTQQCLW